MPNMPFFTLQIPTLPAAGTQGSTPPLQNNAQTQALSPSGQLDNMGAGEGAAGSFSQTLNAQLQVPVLPVGQEFAAMLPPSGALQGELALQQNQDDAAPLEGAWLALQPLMNEPVASAPLDLQDIRRQRALSEKLLSQTNPVDSAQTQALEVATAQGPNVLGSPLPGGSQVNQASPLPLAATQNPIEVGQQREQSLAQNANAVPAFTPKAKPVDPALQGTSTGVDEWLTTELDSELAMKNLHEKPLTLTTKASLQPELMPPPPQALPSEVASPVSSDLVMQGSTGFTKELAGSEPVGQKNPLASTHAEPAQFKLDVPPNNPQWSEQIAKRIGIMSNENVQSARIQLDPPELGALEVKIKIQNDHMTVAFTSGNQQVREALEAQSPRLREMMEAQGLNLNDVNVSDQSNQQAAGGQEQGEFGAQGPLSAMDSENENEESVSVEVQSDSLVDYFA